METVWTDRRVTPMREKLLKFWFWAGRVLPLVALFILTILFYFELDSYLRIVITIVAIGFGLFAFSWWWWVLDTVKNLYGILDNAQERFNQVIKELRNIKADINASNRERKKQSKNQSK